MYIYWCILKLVPVHLLFSEVDIPQPDVNGMNVRGRVDVVDGSLVGISGRGIVPCEVEGMAKQRPGIGVLWGTKRSRNREIISATCSLVFESVCYPGTELDFPALCPGRPGCGYATVILCTQLRYKGLYDHKVHKIWVCKEGLGTRLYKVKTFTLVLLCEIHA